MAKLTLKVIGTNNNKKYPTHQAVVDFLVQRGLVPRLFPFLSWVLPFKSVHEQFDYILRDLSKTFRLPDTYMKRLENNPPDYNVACWPLLDTTRSAIIILSNCDAGDEGVVGEWFRDEVVSRTSYTKEDIAIELSDVDEESLKIDMVGSIRNALVYDKKAEHAVGSYLSSFLGSNIAGVATLSSVSRDAREIKVRFGFMGRLYELAVLNDGGTLAFYVLDTTNNKRFRLQDPEKIKDEIIDSLYFAYGSYIIKAFVHVPRFQFKDYDVVIETHCIIYKYSLPTHDVDIFVNVGAETWHGKVFNNGTLIGETDTCKIKVGNGDIAHNVLDIIRKDNREHLKEGIDTLLQGKASLSDTEPQLNSGTHELTFTGSYEGCPATFTAGANFLTKPEILVRIYDAEQRLVDAVRITNDASERALNCLAYAVAAANKADIDGDTQASPSKPPEVSDCEIKSDTDPLTALGRVTALEEKLSGMLDEVRAVKAMLMPDDDTTVS